MDHPFELGQTYRNRDGDYEVVEISGPNMVIRYRNGRQIETTVKLQTRIWKNIQAEQSLGRPASKPASSPPSVRAGKGLPKKIFDENLGDVFIAYSFVYVDEAVSALQDASTNAEAVVVQPYYKGRIVSAREAMHLYRILTGGRNIPILFTPQTRHEEQRFEYGSRLLDLLHEQELDTVRKNVDEGKWYLWDETLYGSNFLIVQIPIQELETTPPVHVATNLLAGATQGEPTGAVAIPSPKLLDPELRHLLEDL